MSRPAALAAVVLAAGLLAGCPRAPAAAPPAAPRAPARVFFAPPLAEVEVGEQLRLVRLNEEWIYTVKAVVGSEVQVEFIKMVGGDAAGAPLMLRWDRKSFGVPDDAVIVRMEPTERAVGGTPDAPGKVRPCWLLYVSTPEAGRYYYWISEEVGVHGVVALAREHEGRPDETHAMRWVHDTVSGWE